MTKHEATELGFKPVESFTVGDNMVFDLGRGRQLSLSMSTDHYDMLSISQFQEGSQTYIEDIIILHNEDFDGPLTKQKTGIVLKALTYKEPKPKKNFGYYMSVATQHVREARLDYIPRSINGSVWVIKAINDDGTVTITSWIDGHQVMRLDEYRRHIPWDRFLKQEEDYLLSYDDDGDRLWFIGMVDTDFLLYSRTKHVHRRTHAALRNLPYWEDTHQQ